MLETFRNAWKIEDLRKRLIFTLVVLVLFRLGCAIPVPYIDASVLGSMFTTGNMLTYLNMMSGGALSQCTLFALGVQPAINASIIIQLLVVAIPYLENLSKEGEEGRRKLTRITNYTAAGLALVLSIGYYFVIRNMGALKYTAGGFAQIFTAIVIILCFTAGAQLCTWLGNQIDDKGIGNGLSMLIFAGIVARWSSTYTSVQGILTRAQSQPLFYFFLPFVVVLALVAVVFVVVLTNAERR
ncbi:MAG: preprotein translocase subunit SecY, partial [Gemmiger sp.]